MSLNNNILMRQIAKRPIAELVLSQASKASRFDPMFSVLSMTTQFTPQHLPFACIRDPRFQLILSTIDPKGPLRCYSTAHLPQELKSQKATQFSPNHQPCLYVLAMA